MSWIAEMSVATSLRGDRYLPRHGHHATAPCPVCQPEGRPDQQALSISRGADGNVLLHCFKGACSYREIMSAVGSAGFAAVLAASETVPRRPAANQHAAQAERLWNESLPIRGTLAGTYLRRRAITCELPETLRFHSDCWHGPTASRHSAMIAKVQGAAGFAVHRTYLRRDGLGKAGLAGGDKRMLGPTAGGCVRLSPLVDHLVVAEGIETALSLACGLLEGAASIWAALSASGMRGLRLPDRPRHLTIALDGDPPGRAGGEDRAQCALLMGWTVGMMSPGEGHDFNDLLTERVLAS